MKTFGTYIHRQSAPSTWRFLVREMRRQLAEHRLVTVWTETPDKISDQLRKEFPLVSIEKRYAMHGAYLVITEGLPQPKELVDG